VSGPRDSPAQARPHRDAPHPERAHRVYFAVTNACNRACPWCSVYSRPGLDTWLSVDAMAALLPRTGIFEAQLEGGEPLLHPELPAMVARVWATGRCARLVLCTNGLRLPRAHGPLVAALRAFGEPFTLKLSVNHHLHERDPHHLARAEAAAEAIASLRAEGRAVDLVLNLRRRRGGDDDAWLRRALDERGLLPWANDFFLQRYGLAEGDEALDPPYLAGTNFTLVNPDGSTWGTDLVARSRAMGRLP